MNIYCAFMELDSYVLFTAEKLLEEEERQRLCCALHQSPENRLLVCGHKVFILSVPHCGLPSGLPSQGASLQPF